MLSATMAFTLIVNYKRPAKKIITNFDKFNRSNYKTNNFWRQINFYRRTCKWDLFCDYWKCKRRKDCI